MSSKTKQTEEPTTSALYTRPFYQDPASVMILLFGVAIIGFFVVMLVSHR